MALVQSLYKCAEIVTPYMGFIIVDECHRTPSRTFTEAVTAFDCKYMLGLSATPWRRDRPSRLIYFHLGDVVHEIQKEDLISTGDVLEVEIISRETDFDTSFDPSTEYNKMLRELTEDLQRNTLIAQHVAIESNNGVGVCLVLSDRKSHCHTLRKLLAKQDICSELLNGDLSNAQRKNVLDRLNRNRVKVLVVTGHLIREGFDCKELTTLFLATRIEFSGRVLQYLGRVVRPAPGNDKARVCDYIDTKVGMLVAAAKSRFKVYCNDKDGTDKNELG